MKAVQVDPSNLEALLELGVSFTNELDELHALAYLHSWLQHHPDFRGKHYVSLLGERLALTCNGSECGAVIVIACVSVDMCVSQHVPGDAPTDRANLVEMFVRASAFAPNDSDVWTVLGVLYNVSRCVPLHQMSCARARVCVCC